VYTQSSSLSRCTTGLDDFDQWTGNSDDESDTFDCFGRGIQPALNKNRNVTTAITLDDEVTVAESTLPRLSLPRVTMSLETEAKIRKNKEAIESFKASLETQDKWSQDLPDMSVDSDTENTNEPQISLKIRLKNKSAVSSYTCGRQEKLKKLLSTFCLDHDVCQTTVKLCFDGLSLDVNKSAEELELEDGDLIDAVMS